MNHKIIFISLILFLGAGSQASSPEEKLLQLETDRLKIETQKTLTYSQINIIKNNI